MNLCRVLSVKNKKILIWNVNIWYFSLLSISYNGARSFAINSLAIKLIYNQLSCYPNICYLTHLLSTQVRSHSFAINLDLICYQVSTAIDTFTIKPHLLLEQFSIISQLHSTFLLSVIICYQIFDLVLIFIFTNFVPKITSTNNDIKDDLLEKAGIVWLQFPLSSQTKVLISETPSICHVFASFGRPLGVSTKFPLEDDLVTCQGSFKNTVL